SKTITTVSILNLIIKLIMCIIVPNLIIFGLFFRSKEFEYVNEQIISKIKNKLKAIAIQRKRNSYEIEQEDLHD
ncbi:MAG: hypothetical protein H6Q59_2502, partial [Firmicutes bacterium]|nr:hypothetical protein [Bacillota bacterium]